MERPVDVLTHSRFDVGAIEGQVKLEELVCTVDVVEDIFCGVQNNLCDRAFLDFDIFRTVTLT